jgi:hypothetical protein
MKKNPKLSIVVASRNDSYSGNPMSRLQSMITVLVALTNKYKANFELIIVEYNPPRDRPYLNNVLQIENNTYLNVRFIQVPYSFHKTLNVSKKMPLMEWIAKNIGVRRALGNYILCTNIDIVFSDELVNFLVNEKLDMRVFYRINRSDISIKEFPKNLSGMEIVALCRTHVYRTITSKKVITSTFTFRGIKALIISIIYFTWQYIKIGIHKIQNGNNGQTATLILRDTPYHHGAAGDFLLMHRNLWKIVHGYDEAPVSGFMDVSILYELGCLGFTQKILPFHIYHIEHSWGRLGRPTFDVTAFNQKCKNMLDTGIPYKRKSVSWGGQNRNFLEFSTGRF